MIPWNLQMFARNFNFQLLPFAPQAGCRLENGTRLADGAQCGVNATEGSQVGKWDKKVIL